MNECIKLVQMYFCGACNIYIYMYNLVVVPRYLLLFGHLFAKLLYFV